MRPRVLLWKHQIWEASGQNLGDLAIITATIDALKREIPDVEIVLPSDDPAHTAEVYGVTPLPFSLGALRRAIREVDLVILDGGTLFTDQTSMAVPVNAAAVYEAARAGTPVVGYGIATGPLNPVSRAVVRGAMKRMAFACVRDDETVAQLAAIEPSARDRIHMTEDTAFTLRVPEPRPQRADRVLISPRRIFHYGNTMLPYTVRRKLGLLPRGLDQKMDEFKTLLAEVADHIVERHDCEVVFLPMYTAVGQDSGSKRTGTMFSSRDDLVSEDIRSRMRNKEASRTFISDRPYDVLRLLASSRMLMGVPLHSLILSHVAETPFVGLSYQPKVERFVRRAGLERFMIHVESMECPLDRDEFIGKVDACLAEEDALREQLRAGNAAMREVVELPAKMIADLLARP